MEIKNIVLEEADCWWKLFLINNKTIRAITGFNFNLRIEKDFFSKDQAEKIAIDFLQKNWPKIKNESFKNQELSGEKIFANINVYLWWSYSHMASISNLKK